MNKNRPSTRKLLTAFVPIFHNLFWRKLVLSQLHLIILESWDVVSSLLHRSFLAARKFINSYAVSKIGYTMFEIIAVVMILAAATSFAIVKYGDYMRKIKSQEGRQVLTALFAAQIEFRRIGDGVNFFTGNLAQINATPNPLNVTFNQPLRHFQNLTAENASVICGQIRVGRIVAIDNSYELSITNEGNIICTVNDLCAQPLCGRIN